MKSLEGYTKEKKTIDINKAGKVGFVVMGISIIVFAAPFLLIWEPKFSWLVFAIGLMIFPILTLIGAALHELIHGLCFGLCAKGGFRSVKFGVLWKYLTPYCHCTEPLKIKHYLIGALMPTLVLGVIPAIVSLFTGSLICLIFGIIFMGAGAGDFMIVWILRHENKSDYVQDHPSEPGCFVYRESSF